MKYQAKVGLLCISLEGECVDFAQKFEQKAREQLDKLGIIILNEPGIWMKTSDIVEQAKKVQFMGADAIIYLVGTWILADGVVSAIQQTYVHSAIWGVPEPVSFSSVGANVLHGALCEMGIEHKLFYGMPDDPDTLCEVADYCAACMAAEKLKSARLGLIGGRAISAYTTTADPNQIKSIFGVEVDHIDQMVVLEKARAISDAEALQRFEQIQANYKAFEAPVDLIIRSMKVHFAIEQVMAEYRLDMTSIKCLGNFINTYTSCCMAVVLSNDMGRVLSCQSDINATLSMYIMKLLSGGNAVFFGDISTVDYKSREVRVINCGAMPTDMSRTRKDIRWVSQYEYMSVGRGVCPVFCMKEGPITFGYLGRRKGKYQMLIASGTAFEKSMQEVVSVRKWPQGFIHLAGDPKLFYHNLLSNHCVWGYCNCAQRLLEFCSLYDIQPVVV